MGAWGPESRASSEAGPTTACLPSSRKSGRSPEAVMPIAPTYPGVYVEEIPSGVRTIVGVATSITAFVGRALRGPVNRPVTINNFGDFERMFGGLWLDNALGYSVADFF